MTRPKAPLFWSVLTIAILVASPAWCVDARIPERADLEELMPEGGSLTGREIYKRSLEQNYKESLQRLRVESVDPGGSSQTVSFTLSTQDLRDEEQRPTDGVLANTRVEVHAPFDMRNTAYLMIAKDPGPDDQFVYKPSNQRVLRANFKDTSLMGTDFTFNDIAFQDLEDADYIRLDDEAIDGTPVYVVETNVKETLDIEHHRTVAYIEKEHYIPLRVRYWDAAGVEIKELTVPRDKIEQLDEVWVARESRMRNLLEATESVMYLDSLDTSPRFHRRWFTPSELAKGR